MSCSLAFRPSQKVLPNPQDQLGLVTLYLLRLPHPLPPSPGSSQISEVIFFPCYKYVFHVLWSSDTCERYSQMYETSYNSLLFSSFAFLPTTPSPRSPPQGRGEKKISWSLEEKLVSSYVSGLPRAANFRRLLLLGITFVTCIGSGREGGRREG